MAKKNNNIQLWLIGDGPERKNIEQQAHHLGITPQIRYWGYQENIPAFLSKVFVGVLPSQNEGLPNAIIEYMAARLPVVATDVGGNSEVVIHNKTGLLVPFGDTKRMAEAIQFFLDNPLEAHRFGEAGRLRIEEFFSIERMVHETEEVYQSLV